MSGFRRPVDALATLVLLAMPCHLWLFPLCAPPPARWETAQVGPPDPALAALESYFAARTDVLDPAERERTVRTILAESRRAGLDPTLVLAVIEVESRGDPIAVSPAGALGLMQLLPATGEEVAASIGEPWHGPTTLLDPVANVRLGIHYLAELQRRFGNLSTALAAYNWGPTHIARRQRVGRALPVVYPGLVLSALDRLDSAA